MKYFFFIITIVYFSSCKNKNVVTNKIENLKTDTIANAYESTAKQPEKITKYFFDNKVSFDLITNDISQTFITNGKYQNKIFFGDTVNICFLDSILLVDLNFDGKLDIDFKGSPCHSYPTNWMHAFFISGKDGMKYVECNDISNYKIDKNKKRVYSISVETDSYELRELKFQDDKLIEVKSIYMEQKDNKWSYFLSINGKQKIIKTDTIAKFPKEFADIDI